MPASLRDARVWQMKTQHLITEFERTRLDLPHWQGPGETYFVRFSPRANVSVDLDRADIAPIVIESLRYFDGVRYLLLDFVVMPDHVHCILKPLRQAHGFPSLLSIMDSIKHWTALRINRVLERKGQLWRREQYDHVLRNQQDYVEKALYIYTNPKVAGLVDDPSEWPWWGIGSGAGGVADRASRSDAGTRLPRAWRNNAGKPAAQVGEKTND